MELIKFLERRGLLSADKVEGTESANIPVDVMALLGVKSVKVKKSVHRKLTHTNDDELFRIVNKMLAVSTLSAYAADLLRSKYDLDLATYRKVIATPAGAKLMADIVESKPGMPAVELDFV